MTTTSVTAASPDAISTGGPPPSDRRGSWIPTLSLITTRMMELRKRRGLMIALVVVNIGIPATFLIVRLIAHAIAPKSYGPAGGYSVFTGLVVFLMYVFGFIVAAVVGCSAGSTDLTDGMFRHLVVTGRSRVALYLARIPAGLAIVLPIVAAGFIFVCAVCVFAAPTKDSFENVTVPSGLSLTGFEQWAGAHADEVLCNFNFNGGVQNVPITFPTSCPGGGQNGPGQGGPQPTAAQLRASAILVAQYNYTSYKDTFLKPANSLMIATGLWILLEATIGFIVGLGLSSLLGQRTIPVVLMIVLEVILTPIFSRQAIPHFINFQRGVVGLAMAHIEPPALPVVFSGGGGGPGQGPHLVAESTWTAIIVIVAWLVFWTVIGGWRMVKRDA
jgi:hypothetical protein